jgi:hypothetical protein
MGNFGWSELFDSLTSIAAVAAFVLAFLGLRAWRDEKINGRRIDVAEEVSILVLKSKDVFDHTREQFSLSNEGTSRKKNDNESDRETQELNHLYVPIERLNYHSAYFERVIEARPAAKILIGDDAFMMLENILIFRNKIIGSARYEFIMRKRPKTQPLSDRDIAEMSRNDAIKFATGSEEDILTKEIKDNIENCERLIFPIIKKHLKE